MQTQILANFCISAVYWCCCNVVIANITKIYILKMPHSIHLFTIQKSECMKTISWIWLVLHPQFHWKSFQAPSKLNRTKTPSVSLSLCVSMYVCMFVCLNRCVCDFHWNQGNKSIFGVHCTHVCVMRWQNCFAWFNWHEKPAFLVMLSKKNWK